MNEPTGSLSHPPKKTDEQRCREIVEQAGFTYQGVLPAFPKRRGRTAALCLWRAASGSTYALPVEQITVNDVRAHTYTMESRFTP